MCFSAVWRSSSTVERLLEKLRAFWLGNKMAALGATRVRACDVQCVSKDRPLVTLATGWLCAV